jgi:hypothetical protein
LRHGREKALTTSLLLGGVVGGPGFLVVALGAGALRRDYSALHQPVSLLSLGMGGWVQIENFVVTGLLMVSCAAGLRRTVRSGRGPAWSPLLIGIYGLGLVGAGVFPPDPSYGYPPGAALGPAASFSAHGALHEITSVILVAALTAACFVFGRHFAQAGCGAWAAYSFVTGLAVPVFLVGAFIAWSSGTTVNFGGVFQRMALAAGWTWISSLALRIISEVT